VITLVINYIKLIEYTDCEAMMRGELRLLDMRFQFASLIDAKALSYGCLTIDISCTTPIGIALAYAPIAARDRRTRTMTIDWSKSAVLTNDRSLVLELMDDIYNCEARMPTDIYEWLEPIFASGSGSNDTRAIENGNRHHHNHQRGHVELNGNGKRYSRTNRDDDDADADDTDTGDGGDVDQQQQLIGYCINFTNVPSFNLSFLTYLRQKYGARWLSALVLFPHQRAPQRLAISIRCETALIQNIMPSAASGSKRIRTIIENELVNE
jgi:hypothetical protein